MSHDENMINQQGSAVVDAEARASATGDADDSTSREHLERVDSDATTEGRPAAGECKWCGSVTRKGFRYCPNCHRAQGRIPGFLGSTANAIAVIGVVLTFLQFALAWNESRQAKQAAVTASLAMAATEDLLENVSGLEERVSDLRLSAQESAREAKDALLQVAETRARLDELTAAARREVENARAEVEARRIEYHSLREELQRTPTQIQVPETRVVYEFIRVGPVKTKVPKAQVKLIDKPNPEYAEKQRQLDAAEASLSEAEARLTALLQESAQETD